MRRTHNPPPVLPVVAAVAALYAAYRVGLSRGAAAPPIQMPCPACADSDFNVRSGAQAILTLCDACDRLRPALGPLSRGNIPPVSALMDAFGRT